MIMQYFQCFYQQQSNFTSLNLHFFRNLMYLCSWKVIVTGVIYDLSYASRPIAISSNLKSIRTIWK